MIQPRTVATMILFVSLGTWALLPDDQSDSNLRPLVSAKRPSLFDINHRMLQVSSQLHAADTQIGERLYVKHCAACHGQDFENSHSMTSYR